MIVLIIIYIISLIGAILAIRYDEGLFDEGGKDPNVTSLYKYYK